MDIKTILLSIKKMFFNSQKSIHLISWILSIIIIFIFSFFSECLNSNLGDEVLTGTSILASFFLLTLQNIDYEFLNKHFNKQVKVLGTKYNKESVVIRSTVFSLAVSVFVLTAICFILYILKINIIYTLVLLIVYLFVSIIYSVILWNYFCSKK